MLARIPGGNGCVIKYGKEHHCARSALRIQNLITKLWTNTRKIVEVEIYRNFAIKLVNGELKTNRNFLIKIKKEMKEKKLKKET